MKRTISLLLALLLLVGCTAVSALAEDKEPITIRVMTFANAMTLDCNELPVWQDLQKKTGITIDWDQISSGYDEKKALVLGTLELPDVFFSGLNDSDLIMNEGAFMDLSELVKDCPNIQKMFAEVPSTLRMSVSPDGAIYSLPSIEPFCTDSYTVMMINKAWLDKLNLDMPTTFDELEKVLIAFRDLDPNGNGQKDEIPLDWNAGRGSIFPIHALCGAYGVVQDFSADMVTVKDGKVDFVWATEAYKNVQAYLARLYSQNLINQEVFTQDYGGMMAKSKQGELALVGVTLGWSIEDRMGQFAKQYAVLPPLKATADSTEKVLWPSNPARTKLLTNRVSLSAKTPHAKRIMELIDLLYSEYYTIQMTFGSIPNQILYDAEKDTYFVTDPAEGENLEVRNRTNGLVNLVPKYGSTALEAKTRVPYEAISRLEQEVPYKPYFTDEVYPVVKFNAEELEELTFLTTDIYKVVDEKMASWVVNGNIEQEWNEYINKLNGMGLEKMRGIYQKAYDDYMAN